MVKSGGIVFLVESGVKNSHNKGVFRILARAEFRGNTNVTHDDFAKHFSKHRVSKEEYDSVRKNWVDRGSCVLWELIVKQIFNPCLYLVPRQGEAQVVKKVQPYRIVRCH